MIVHAPMDRKQPPFSKDIELQQPSQSPPRVSAADCLPNAFENWKSMLSSLAYESRPGMVPPILTVRSLLSIASGQGILRPLKSCPHRIRTAAAPLLLLPPLSH